MTSRDDALLLLDTHNDLPTMLRRTAGYRVGGLDRLRPELHTDLVRLRTGGVNAQVWSLFVPASLAPGDAVLAAFEQLDAVHRLVERHPDRLALARTAQDVERIVATGRISSLLGLEGGHSIGGSLAVLRSFARAGVRMMTLTHNSSLEWADSATDLPRCGGLSAAGRAVVAEMNRLGMVVDLSHTAATTQHAALAVSAAPVIFSHSNVQEVCPHPRNVSSEVLTSMTRAGGVVQIAFAAAFVSHAYWRWSLERADERTRLGLPPAERPWPPGRGLETPHGGAATGVERDARHRELDRWVEANPAPAVDVREVADHIDAARQIVGVEHVGLGSDFDGVEAVPDGLRDVAGYPRLLAELAHRGWSRADLRALAGRNTLRVLAEAESVARAAGTTMQHESPASVT